MVAIDVLRHVQAGGGEAGVYAGGICIDRPWGRLDAGTVDLAAGWYRLSVRQSDGPVKLRLSQPDIASLMELTVESGCPVYIRLEAGRYDLCVQAGARPGRYRVENLCLEPLGVLSLAAMLGGRLLSAVRSGLSVGRIAGLVRRALAGRGSFGARAPSQRSSVLEAPHSRFDCLHHARLADETGQQRLAKLARPLLFLICDSAGGTVSADRLAAQIYPHWSIRPEDDWDFRLIIDAEERLTRDALLLFAECILSAEKPCRAVIADVWRGNEATARIAWDPILYASHLPTPCALRRDVEGLSFALEEAQLVAVPVASAPMVSGETTLPLSVPVPVEADRPGCTIIIPTRDRSDLLEACLEGLFDNTDWPHEVIVIDNGSSEPETFAVFERFAAKGLRIVRNAGLFNFSALCNQGVREVNTPYVVFLNNDIVLQDRNWLGNMMRHAQRTNIGAVGARLLYDDLTLQHGGVAIGLTEACGHLWRGTPYDQIAGNERLLHSSLRAAVTAACLCVAVDKFNAVGGFDEDAFPVTLNDVDLCLKLTRRGWYSLYCADAQALHLEGKSRGEDLNAAKRSRRERELRVFAERWHSFIECDPWLSPATTRADETGRLG